MEKNVVKNTRTRTMACSGASELRGRPIRGFHIAEIQVADPRPGSGEKMNNMGPSLALLLFVAAIECTDLTGCNFVLDKRKGRLRIECALAELSEFVFEGAADSAIDEDSVQGKWDPSSDFDNGLKAFFQLI